MQIASSFFYVEWSFDHHYGTMLALSAIGGLICRSPVCCTSRKTCILKYFYCACEQAARAGGALLLAPLVEKGLNAFESALHLKSRKSAFLYILFICLGLTAALFGAVVVVHA